MANYLTYMFKDEMLGGDFDFDANTFGAQLCTSGPAENAADPVIGDIVGPAVGTTIDPTIALPTHVSGVFNGDDVTFVAITGGGNAGAFDQICIYVKSGTNANRVMAMIDITQVTATNGNIAVQWDNSVIQGETGAIFAV